MKLLSQPNRILLIAFLICQLQLAFAQVPQQINYQGALRDAKGNPVINRQITLRLSIQDEGLNGFSHYSEVRSLKTNAVGLYTVAIGSPGAIETKGNFGNIPWGTSPKYLKVEVDPEGGYDYTLAGLTPLLSVPYSLYAKYAENGPVGPQGPAGPAGANGSTILSGTTNPVAGQGNPGDYYFNTTTNVLYGPQNPDGTWPPGTTLLQGPAGPAGPIGAPGPIGPQGPVGPMGPQGINGIGVQQVFIDANGHLIIRLTDNSNVDAGLVVGAPGAQGPAGPQGVAGTDGRAVIGAQLDVVGNLILTFSDNTTTNVGPVLGPQGPAGPAGAQGPIGLTGAAGPIGPQGEDGKSAFDIWQSLPGNENKTVQEFLTTLQGTTITDVKVTEGTGELLVNLNDGTTINAGVVLGPQGPIGPVGATGPKGDSGPVGPQGPAGPAGPIGATGPAGIQGPMGPQGIACWDINMNGVNDPAEDINGDGLFNTSDCVSSNKTEVTLTNSHIFVGDKTNVAQDVAMSGDATIDNNGVVTISDGAVTLNKMADGIPDQIYVTDANGHPALASVNNLGWGLRGNAGTVYGTNFLGTTDDQPLSFRVFNEHAGRIYAPSRITSFGFKAGANIDDTSVQNAVYIGHGSGESATNLVGSTFLGAWTGNSLVSGSPENTLIGYFSGYKLQSAAENTFVGSQSGINILNGSNNTFIGANVAQNATAATSNTWIGHNAGANSNNVTNSVLIGKGSGIGNNLTNATAIGYQAIATASNSMVLGGFGTNRVNVGIGGVTAPAQRLHIDGNFRIDNGIFISTQTAATTVVVTNANGITGVNPGAVNLTNVRGQVAAIGPNDGNSFTQLTINFSSPTPYSSAPLVTVTPANSAAADAQFYVSSTVTGFSIFYKNKTPNTNHAAFNYWVIQ